MARERARGGRAVARDGRVAGGAVDADEKPAGGAGGGARPRAGEDRGACAGDGGRDEMAPWTHVLLQRNARAAPRSPIRARCAPVGAQRRARNGASASGPTTPAIYSPSGAISPRRRWVSGYVPVAMFGVLIIA